MRDRKSRKIEKPSQNLDSFLDILTNTVGVLMFIGLFVSLLAVESGRTIRTPLRKETSKTPKFFELRNNQVFLISAPEIEEKIDELIASLPSCEMPEIGRDTPEYMYEYYLRKAQEYQLCMNSRLERIKNFYVDNGKYIVTIGENGGIVFQPRKDVSGETIEEFVNFLKQLNPRENYIAFIVRPDSFRVFRKARQTAWNLGFDVGWEPLEYDSVLVFGSGGREVGVQ
ncbi:MAG: hypothetical protein NZ901_12650 [Geminocystis sp.]|nr:hypothetical protein [Geminocystis sp.]HIK37799.1 hypothetical protein [Geminocystis sp. M7585_C2015_104]MCS7149017.1 hypothetical protein [Geminocystis sp.]MCX8078060.1 hypothetical protein [Geminocystis sp.]MDW8114837.1 hypothetical protein [Geminocystis sp.]